ncbi:MAG TPA: VrrA/YqfQ family protein [Bacillota bacterium]|nr:VrrA/YqfQ family protein [Bacillota bacterium]
MRWPIRRIDGVSQPTARNKIPYFNPYQTAFHKPPQGSHTGGVLHRLLAHFNTNGEGGIMTTLNNVQQVLRMIQSAAPLVEKYGPVIKNLPALYKMIKAFNEVEDSATTETPRTHYTEYDDDQLDDIPNKDMQTGMSIPKLYI